MTEQLPKRPDDALIALREEQADAFREHIGGRVFGRYATTKEALVAYRADPRTINYLQALDDYGINDQYRHTTIGILDGTEFRQEHSHD